MNQKEQPWNVKLTSAREFFQRFFLQAHDLVNLYRSYTSDTFFDPIIHRKSSFSPSSHKAYNILWSNTQILVPSVYQQPPKASVSRRFNDKDPVGRVASEIIERCLEVSIEDSGLDDAMRMAVKARFIMGQGVSWIRYSPVFYTDQNGQEQQKDAITVDFVNFWDFLCSPARNFEEVTWVARRAYMTPKTFQERFNKDPTEYKTSFQGRDGETYPTVGRIFVGEDVVGVWEIWDKETKKVIFLAASNDDVLEETNDFLGLEGFFPCPKPLYSDLAPGHLIPVPEYIQCLSFAEIINQTTMKIESLTGAIKVVGIYDKEFKELPLILDPAFEGKLIPVDNFSSLKANGGANGGIEIIDFTQTVDALQALYNQREQAKQNLDEIMGISDILRGSTDPIETATSQTIKSQYASIRLKNMQDAVSSFVGRTVKIMGEIIAKHYSPESLLEISGMQQSDDADPGTIQGAMQLIKDPIAFGFRVDIETDALVVKDQKAEQNSRTEVMNMIVQFFQQMGNIPPSMIPLATQTLLFVLRAFPQSRELEQAIEQTTQILQQQAQQQAQAAQQMQQDQGAQQAGAPGSPAQGATPGTVTNINVDAQKPLSPDALLKSDTDIQKKIFDILNAQMVIRKEEGNPMTAQELEAITNNILSLNEHSDMKAVAFGKMNEGNVQNNPQNMQNNVNSA